MTCKEIGLKEKSLSLNRLFSPDQNKKKKAKRNKKKEIKVSNCQILENKKTIDEGEGSIKKYSEEENNNQWKEKQIRLGSTLRTEGTCSAVDTDKNTIEVNIRTCSSSIVSVASSFDNKVKPEQFDDDRKIIFSIIFEAIQYKDVTMIHRVIQSYPYLDINELNEDGIAVIHFAAMVGSATTIEPLLKYGADIDLKDIRGNPPLHYAYNMKKFEFVSTALKFGANINLLNKEDISKLEKILGKNW